MTIIQQPTLFDIDFLEQLDIQEKYAQIFSPLEWAKLLALFDKDTAVGAPVTINYEAVLRSILARFYEQIPSQKKLIERLEEDLRFKLSMGFLYSEPVPSEATYSRVMKRLSEHLELLENLNQELLQLIHQDFGIFDENVAIDVTAVKARTKQKKTENPKLPSTEEQRSMPTETILEQIPTYPSWGVKKNSQGKNNYWFGHKATLAVSSNSQYILHMHIASAFAADVSLAIPTIRKVDALTKAARPVNDYLFDKGYDANAIYEELHHLGHEPIIALKKVPDNNGEVDAHFTPTCLLEHSYRYDSFDKRYGALKFLRPEAHCRECPLQHEGLCQKVIKVKQMNDPRKYNHPARGTLAWKQLYNQRSSVERVNGYLKSTYQLNQTKHYQAPQAIAEYLLIQLAYNAKTFANQRMKYTKKRKEAAA